MGRKKGVQASQQCAPLHGELCPYSFLLSLPNHGFLAGGSLFAGFGAPVDGSPCAFYRAICPCVCVCVVETFPGCPRDRRLTGFCGSLPPSSTPLFFFSFLFSFFPFFFSLFGEAGEGGVFSWLGERREEGREERKGWNILTVFRSGLYSGKG